MAACAGRRIRRIVPALALVVFATLVAGYFVFLPADLMELGKSAVAQALLVANYHYWMISGYFEEAAEMKPLMSFRDFSTRSRTCSVDTSPSPSR